MKEIKEKGIPVIGSYCTYFPKEIAMAMGAVTVGLCGTSEEPIQEAQKDLPKNPVSPDSVQLWICKDRYLPVLLFF